MRIVLEHEGRIGMAFWLIKSDPEVYSFTDLERDEKTVWDGVLNNTALMHVRGMKKGDSVFVYHSGREKSIVGIAEVASTPYPDPKKSDPKMVVIDLKVVRRLGNPVTLAAIKAKSLFVDFPLVRISRLSVMPVTTAQWKALLTMSRVGWD
jgi:predicted RNA-binding protein with PUA-like domain